MIEENVLVRGDDNECLQIIIVINVALQRLFRLLADLCSNNILEHSLLALYRRLLFFTIHYVMSIR